MVSLLLTYIGFLLLNPIYSATVPNVSRVVPQQNLKYLNFNLQERKLQVLNKQTLKPGKPLKILLHGWSPWKIDDIGTLLSAQNLDLVLREFCNQAGKRHTVIVVDWMYMATNWLFSAVSASWTIGEDIAQYLIELKKSGTIREWADVHIIGYSLGAHIAGVVGHFVKQRTNKTLGRITGLDPEGPLFDHWYYSRYYDNQKSLDKDDAKFVDVIHTNAGTFGSSVQSGHADFYPNGGSKQVQCATSWEIFTGCSHKYAVIYYAMAMRHPDVFISCSCSSYDAFSNGNCSCNNTSGTPLGEYALNTARGKYFLSVNAVDFGKPVISGNRSIAAE